MDNFSKACQQFSLTISQKKTNMMGQSFEASLTIKINNYNLEVVYKLVHVSTIILNTTAATFPRLTPKVWSNRKLTKNTKITVNKA